jgi:hypothetical protein
MKTRTMKMLGMYLLLAALTWLSWARIIPSVAVAPLFLVVLIVMVVYIFSPYIPPSWVGRVTRDGKQAQATVLANDFANARGADLWVALPVEVNPADGPAFKTRMHCKSSRASGLAAGASVSVYYDPARKLALQA